MQRRDFLKASALPLLGTTALPAANAAAPIELPMFYPVAVGGPIAKILDDYAEQFHKANPDVLGPVNTNCEDHRPPARS